MENESDGFVQRAEGRFDVLLAPNTPHCGPQTAPFPLPAEFSYSVEVDYSPAALDSQGFLLDNTDFQHYFDGLKEQPPVDYSCELIAKRAAEAFCKMLGVRAAECHKICCRIWGLPGVSIEYILHPEVAASARAAA